MAPAINTAAAAAHSNLKLRSAAKVMRMPRRALTRLRRKFLFLPGLRFLAPAVREKLEGEPEGRRA
jgi:hypothetical protein